MSQAVAAASPWRSILVHADSSDAALRRLALAHALALQHDAMLTALYACSPQLAESSNVFSASAASVDHIELELAERQARVRDAFQALVGTTPLQLQHGGAGRDGTAPLRRWAQIAGEAAAPAFAQQAMHADLLVLGQYDPADPASRELPQNFVESVLIGSGRPALVLPRAVPAQPPCGPAVVAWKASPESARALVNALPLLRAASAVHVVAWGEAPSHAIGARIDVQAHLAAHGIDATLQRERAVPSNVGAALLAIVAELKAELLVMGCYGHSRTRELLLGGASRTLLQSMNVPVLMSH